MRKRFVIILIPVTAILFSGCMAVVSMSGGYHRTSIYCYDCHVHPRWVTTHKQCEYYIVKVKDDHYYYGRPNDQRHYVNRKYFDWDDLKKRQAEHEDYIKSQGIEIIKDKDTDNSGIRKKSFSFK